MPIPGLTLRPCGFLLQKSSSLPTYRHYSRLALLHDLHAMPGKFEVFTGSRLQLLHARELYPGDGRRGSPLRILGASCVPQIPT